MMPLLWRCDQYSRNRWRRHRYLTLNKWRRGQYLILNKLARGAIGFKTETRSILNNSIASGSAGQINMILNESSETRNKHWTDTLDTQGTIGGAIDIRCSTILREVLAEALIGSNRYSRDWRRDWYLILKGFMETRSIFNTLLNRGQTPWRWSN